MTAGLELLAARELLPFAAAVRAGAEAVMTAHVRVPALDGDRPASTSRAVTRLRQDLGFDGVVVTDAIDMAGVSGPADHGSVAAAAVAALQAGADLVCLGANWDRPRVHEVVDAIETAVQDGHLPRARLSEAARRVAWLGETCRRRRVVAGSGSTTTVEPATDGPSAHAMQAARAGLRAEGTLPTVTGAVVLRLLDEANAAVGEVAWGLQHDLAALAPGVVGTDTLPTDDPGDLLAGAADRPLVLVARDTHRSAAVRGWLDQVLAVRPDAVLVDLGWPSPRTQRPPRGALVQAHGAGSVSTRAVAELLAGDAR